MTVLRTLTPADVDALRAALRIAIRTQEQTLHHERPHLPPGAIANRKTQLANFRRLADGLSPSQPPSVTPDTNPEPEQ